MEKKGEMGVIGMMLIVEIITVSCTTITKAAITFGMNSIVFFVYFRLLAILLLLPACFFLYRNVRLPSMAVPTVLRIFLLAFLNYFGMWVMLKGLSYSSPTLLSAISNLNPAFTFIFALLFRMESLNLNERSSLLKLLGTIILVCGGFIIVLYQGFPITFSPSSPDSVHKLHPLSSLGGHWTLGGVFLLAASLAISISYIVKTRISRDYPFEMMVTLLCTIFEAMIAIVVAAFEQRDQHAWRLRLDIVSLAIVSAAILLVGVVSPVHLWVSRKRGPVFLAMFMPLQMLIAMILGVATLGDTLHIGSVIGGAIIAVGFYTVMRGKSMEDKSPKDGGGALLSDGLSPEQAVLLQPKSMNV